MARQFGSGVLHDERRPGVSRLTEEAKECHQDSCGTVHLVISVSDGHFCVFMLKK